ncbi:flagellar basal body-associated FliL family protein [Curvivirga sp.]|uniref:flagellar basal body-associated FliL family protein n=1 Tax=Curvivirga sp. TaxID=2856848 RepID=UPI003B59CF39
MADEGGVAEGADGEDEEGGKKRVSGKKLVLFILLPILILIGAGVGLFLSGMLDPLLGGGDEVTEEAAEDTPVEVAEAPSIFLPLDEILVTLRSPGSKQKFLKLQVSLEISTIEEQAHIENLKPRIVDSFQVFLRELRLEELEGSQGVYRIKEELLDRVNKAIAPVKAKDVLFNDLIVQ